jgi:hypothetical protein
MNPIFLVQIVKAIIKGMTNTTTHVTPTVSTPVAASRISTTTNNVVLLV